MAQKKSKSSKPTASAPKAPVVRKITSDKEAIEYVKERFKDSPGDVEYVVMENCNIFYGLNRSTAIRYAKDFSLKYFEVKA